MRKGGDGSLIGGASVPLVDALPWHHHSCSPRTLLINDSIGSDGRFLMYLLAASQRVLWLSCSPITDAQISQGIKKIGCDKGVLSSITIRNLTTELCSRQLSLCSDDGANNYDEDFLCDVYNSTESWLAETLQKKDDQRSSHNWIIVDDASALANLLGERLAYRFLLALNSKQNTPPSSDQEKPFGLMIRCSNDHEIESLPTFAGTSAASSATEWFGAGGMLQEQQQPERAVAWERSLVEIADGIVDVLPLTSGYTRELHGRIVLTQTPWGLGWGDTDIDNDTNQQKRMRSPRPLKSSSPMQTINYCITDQKIVGYRI